MNFIPAFWNIFPPHTTISFSRRLFRHASTVGSVGWIYSPIGMRSLEVDIHSPQPFDFSSPEDYVHYTDRMDADFANRPGSVSGFGVGLQAWSYGFRLSGLHSCIKTEWTIWFLELSLSLKASLELVGYCNLARHK
jgi:DnaJ family protein C protein 11